MLKRLLIVACLVLAPCAVLADTMNDARNAMARGDYAIVMKLLRPLAMQGNADAQTGIGILYLQGYGVPQDDSEAASWFRLAAGQGDLQAQAILGSMYDEGKGVPHQPHKAEQWLLKAAERGHADAQLLLGTLYLGERGLPKDMVAAHMWFSLAGDNFGKWRLTETKRRFAANAAFLITMDMTKRQIARSQLLANEWKAKWAQ